MREQPGEADLPEDPKVEIAVFGRDVELFLETDPIGQFVVSRIRETIELAKNELLVADPHDPEEIRDIQNRAQVAEHCRAWFAQAIQDGMNAAQLIQQERDDDNVP